MPNLPLHENEAKKLKLYNSVFLTSNAEISIEKKSKATFEVYLKYTGCF